MRAFQVATAESWEADRMADFRLKSNQEAARLKALHSDAPATTGDEMLRAAVTGAKGER